MTVRLDDLSWTEIRGKLKQPNILILPFGSTEEHGAHLPVKFDSLCATYISEHAAQKALDNYGIQVLVAPTVDYTEVSEHKMFPGTIGIKADTFIQMIKEIVESFIDQGFGNIIALTSHKENTAPLQVALTMVHDERPEAKLIGASSMGLGFDVRQGIVKAGTTGMGHALETETSMGLVIEPEKVHLDKAIIGTRKLPLSERYIGATGGNTNKGIIFCSHIKGFEESGTYGDPTMASKEEGEKILSAVIDDLVDIIFQMAKPGK